MNTNQFNAVIFNATPIFSPTSSLSVDIGFGTSVLILGIPVLFIIDHTNYITKLKDGISYIKKQNSSTNYINLVEV